MDERHLVADQLRRLGDTLGRTPTVSECIRHGIDQHIMKKLFGSIRQAMVAAGLTPRSVGWRPMPAERAAGIEAVSAALAAAGEGGMLVAEVMSATGKGRSYIHRGLERLLALGQATRKMERAEQSGARVWRYFAVNHEPEVASDLEALQVHALPCIQERAQALFEEAVPFPPDLLARAQKVTELVEIDHEAEIGDTALSEVPVEPFTEAQKAAFESMRGAAKQRRRLL